MPRSVSTLILKFHISKHAVQITWLCQYVVIFKELQVQKLLGWTQYVAITTWSNFQVTYTWFIAFEKNPDQQKIVKYLGHTYETLKHPGYSFITSKDEFLMKLSDWRGQHDEIQHTWTLLNTQNMRLIFICLSNNAESNIKLIYCTKKTFVKNGHWHVI